MSGRAEERDPAGPDWAQRAEGQTEGRKDRRVQSPAPTASRARDWQQKDALCARSGLGLQAEAERGLGKSRKEKLTLLSPCNMQPCQGPWEQTEGEAGGWNVLLGAQGRQKHARTENWVQRRAAVAGDGVAPEPAHTTEGLSRAALVSPLKFCSSSDGEDALAGSKRQRW